MPAVSKGALQFAKHVYIHISLCLHSHFVWALVVIPI